MNRDKTKIVNPPMDFCSEHWTWETVQKVRSSEQTLTNQFREKREYANPQREFPQHLGSDFMRTNSSAPPYDQVGDLTWHTENSVFLLESRISFTKKIMIGVKWIRLSEGSIVFCGFFPITSVPTPRRPQSEEVSERRPLTLAVKKCPLQSPEPVLLWGARRKSGEALDQTENIEINFQGHRAHKEHINHSASLSYGSPSPPPRLLLTHPAEPNTFPDSRLLHDIQYLIMTLFIYY